MRMLASLILLLVLAFIVDQFAARWVDLPDDTVESMRTALSVGLLLLGAWLAGLCFDRIHLPKISGYLIFGVVVGPFLPEVLDGMAGGALPAALKDGLISYEQLPRLQFISDLAIALIALTAGGEIRLRWLRGQIRAVSLITVIELISVWAVVGVAVFMLERYVPLIQDAPLSHRIVMAALVGLVAAANSPAVVMAMINEYRAEGPLARTTLAVTIFKDMLMVVLFASTLAIGRGWVSESETLSATFLLAVAVQLLGSLLLGAVAGAVMAFYVHRVGSHLVIFLVGSCMAFALFGEQKFTLLGESLHLEPLLMGLAAGMVMENIWPDESEPLFGTIEAMSLPIYCVFFALAGAKLDLTVLATLWAAGVVGALFAIRAAIVWASVTGAAWLVGFDPAQRGRLWMGFIPQAGIALALASLIQKAFPTDAQVNVENILIGLIAVNELIGPVAFRRGLLTSGEAFQAQDKGKGGASH